MSEDGSLGSNPACVASDPFADWDGLRQMAQDRDMLLAGHAMVLPGKSGQTHHARADVVDHLIQLVHYPNLTVTFHFARCLPAIRGGPGIPPRVADIADRLLAVKPPRNASRGWGYCQDKWSRFAVPSAPEARWGRLVDGLAAAMSEDVPGWSCRCEAMAGDDAGFPPVWPERIQGLVAALLAALDPPLPAWWTEYLDAFRNGRPFWPPSWHQATRFLWEDRFLDSELRRRAKCYFPDQWLDQPGKSAQKKLTEDARAEELIVTVRAELLVVVLRNADDWYARRDGPVSARAKRGKPRRGSQRHQHTTRNWRGYLLNQYPTMMQRQAHYMRHLKKLPTERAFVRSSSLAGEDSDGEPFAAEFPDESAVDPQQEAMRRESQLAVRNALKSLTAEERRVVNLRIMEEHLTYEQIAQECELPVHRIKTILEHAFRRLKPALKKWEDLP